MVAETEKAARKILVTGSNGMLGFDLCRELERRCAVWGIDLPRRSPGSIRRDRFLEKDLTDKAATLEAFSRIRPDVVIHAAAWTDVDGCESDPDKAFRINAEATGNVAAGCRSVNAVLVYLSTDYVFDGSKEAPYTEEDATNPLGVYGDSKLKGEVAVRDTVRRHIIARTSWLFGAHGRNFVDAIVEHAGAERRLQVVDDQKGSPTYTRDLSVALSILVDTVAASDSGFGTYHISNAGSTSWYDYARLIVSLKRLPAEVVPIRTVESKRPAARPKNSVLDNSKFRSFSRHTLRRWEEALKDYLEIA